MELMTLAFLVLLLAFGITVYTNQKLIRKNKELLAENTRIWMKMNEANAMVIKLRGQLDEHIGWPIPEEED
jgi:hypothetical protein